jgi:hypothetical protein
MAFVVIPAKAGIHFQSQQDQNGFRVLRRIASDAAPE